MAISGPPSTRYGSCHLHLQALKVWLPITCFRSTWEGCLLEIWTPRPHCRPLKQNLEGVLEVPICNTFPGKSYAHDSVWSTLWGSSIVWMCGIWRLCHLLMRWLAPTSTVAESLHLHCKWKEHLPTLGRYETKWDSKSRKSLKVLTQLCYL